MEVAELLALIERREGAEVELKPEATWQDEFSKVMVAFANARRGHNGHLIVGVADDEEGRGRLIGLKNLKRVRDNLLSAARRISPPLDEHIILQEFVVRAEDIAENWGEAALREHQGVEWPCQLICVTIPVGMPFVYSDGGTYYRRKGSHNTRMSSAELEEMMLAVRRERLSTEYERSLVPGATLNEIDWGAVENYLEHCRERYQTSFSSTREALLRNLGCVGGPQDAPAPTVAGMLLFGKDPQMFLPMSYLTVVRYRGKEVGDEFEKKDFRGRLPEIAAKATTYLYQEATRHHNRLEGLVRKDIPQYTEFCIRELVLNALIHRDYSFSGARVIVKMFLDRMEIASPGGLPGLVQADSLADAEFLRNPHIARVVHDLGLIEQIGDGVDRVLREVRDHPYKPPKPEWKDTGATVVAKLYSPKEFYEQWETQETQSSRERLRERLAALKPELALSERQIKMLEINLRDGMVEKQRYEDELNLTQRTVERELFNLSRLGLLQPSGSTRDRRYQLPPDLRLQLLD